MVISNNPISTTMSQFMELSIIIPAFNSAKYIRECLHSVLENDLSGCEIIVINDGSQDETLDILHEISIKTDKIHIHSIVNSGQSIARNVGVALSKGDNILFLDSDDKLKPTAISTIINEIKNNRLDLLFFNATVFNDELNEEEISKSFKTAPVYIRPNELVGKIMTGEDFFNESMKLNGYIVQPCMYAFNRKLLVGIEFQAGIIHEDNLFTTQLVLNNADRVKSIREEFYVRRIRTGSTMTSEKSIRNIEGYLACVDGLNIQSSKVDNPVTKKYLSKLIAFLLIDAAKIAKTLGLNYKAEINKLIKGLVHAPFFIKLKAYIINNIKY